MALTHRFFRVLTLATVLATTVAPSVHAQAKWWWEKYPSANDKTLSLRNAVGGSVDAKSNPTGSNVGATTSAATQPPTVIIQQTATSTAAPAMPTMTCFQPSSLSASQSSSYYIGATLASCPNISGFTVTPMVGNNSPAGVYWNGGSYTTSAILGCCYVPVAQAAATPGGAAFSPWTAFGDTGYSGNQHTAFTSPGSYSFSIPANIFRVWVTVVGGGGGGAGNTTSSVGGGSGGILYRYPIDVMPNDTMQVFVASGGGGGNVGSAGTGLYNGQGGFGAYNTYSAAGGGGSSAVRYNTLVAGAGGGSGAVSYEWYNNGAGYGSGAGIRGEGSGMYGGAGYPGSVSVKAGTQAGNGIGGQANGYGGYHANIGAGYAGSGCGGGGAMSYGNGTGGGVGVASGSSCTGASVSGQGGNGGGTSGSSGYGGGGQYSTGAGKPLGNIYPGGGGAGGFIGMSWSTGVPNAGSGKCPSGYGSGGYGYGAGGGGSLTGVGGCTSVATAAGGDGANGAVFIEW